VVDLVDWAEPGMRVALAERDITAVYRLLVRAGISQRRIGALTSQSQSEVSEIIHGRQVVFYGLWSASPTAWVSLVAGWALPTTRTVKGMSRASGWTTILVPPRWRRRVSP
jgi:hypothetical protein